MYTHTNTFMSMITNTIIIMTTVMNMITDIVMRTAVPVIMDVIQRKKHRHF